MKTTTKAGSNSISAQLRPRVQPASLTILAALALALTVSGHAQTPPPPIPFSDIGAKATADYQGDALGITATTDGALLRCGFQKLEGHATPEGLWLESTEPGAAGKLRLVATGVGRTGNSALKPDPSIVHSAQHVAAGILPAVEPVRLARRTSPSIISSGDAVSSEGRAAGCAPSTAGGTPAATMSPGSGVQSAVDALSGLPGSGTVSTEGNVVRFTRPGVAEEYSVGVDGVRQDFVITQRPAGTGELCLELTLSGAQAEAAPDAARLKLEGSGRELVYNRLRAQDATGKELKTRLEVFSTNRLIVAVADAEAEYPVRIDPTFSDTDWVSLNPSLAGADGGVSSIAVDTGGNVYAGGNFTFIGAAHANRIAKWDGSTWSPLGSGVDDYVAAIAVSGTNVYVGGAFTNAGGVSANRIAMWDGNAWSPLGSGMAGGDYPSVNSLAVSGTNLYACGSFTNAGGLSAANIAKWDGTTWSALSSGIGGSGYVAVSALAANETYVYVAGVFQTAGGVSVANIAKWDGTTWSTLSSGIGGYVTALTMTGTNLYAAGYIESAGGVPVNNIAKWDGVSWSALGSGLDVSAPLWDFRLAVSGTNLYVGGWIGKAGDVAVNNIARWDGSTWSALGRGVDNSLLALAASGTNLYVGGGFQTAGGVPVSHIAKWDGSAWSAMGEGISATVRALAVSGTNVYAGGEAARVAKWNGLCWSALGPGMIGVDYRLVCALAVSETSLYAGGYFTNVGAVNAQYIAKWDGTNWSSLGSGMNGSVWALAVIGTNVYAGGEFSMAGGVPANRVARWNGSEWSALGEGVTGGSPPYPIVETLAVAGTDLYAGGIFTRAGHALASCAAKWDGNAWSALGSGISGGSPAFVRALAVIGTNLYAGGNFSSAGGVPVSSIAKWDGKSWSGLDSGVGGGREPQVCALAVSGANLYAAGFFSSAGAKPANYIAKWDGSAWSALGSGIGGTEFPAVWALAADDACHLFVGGKFPLAGTNVSHFIAQANIPGTAPSILIQPESQTVEVGSTVDFRVVAAAVPAVYQWFFNSSNAISGATGPILQLTNVQASQSGAYTVLITNILGAVTSSPATLTIYVVPPAITSPPADSTVYIGDTVQFAVTATGTPPLDYQWCFNATNAISGASNSILQLTNVQFSQSGAYTVVVTNAFGAVTSPPAMFVVQGYAPTILIPPSNQTVAKDDTVGFLVSSTGTQPLAYQWFFNSTNVIVGATETDLLLTNVQLSQAGAYTVVISNTFGAVTSPPALLRVVPYTRIVTQLTDEDLRVQMSRGGTITFDCDGTIPLLDTITVTTNTTLDGTGHRIVISGNDLVGVFDVETNVSFTLADLTVASGAAASGGGILNDGGILTLQQVTIRSNTAILQGGGIFNRGGNVCATNCSFLGNTAYGDGGAICSVGGMNVSSSVFKGNAARGNSGELGAAGGPARGGALFNAGIAELNDNTFVSNIVAGGSGGEGSGGTYVAADGQPGGAGGEGHGGALFNSGLVRLVNDTFFLNSAIGGTGGSGGMGQSTVWPMDPVGNGGDGGAGASASGGAICDISGQCCLTNCHSRRELGKRRIRWTRRAGRQQVV